MAGTGKTYTEPDAGSVAYGTDNIFGTIESGKVRRAKLNYLRDRVGKKAKVKELVK